MSCKDSRTRSWPKSLRKSKRMVLDQSTLIMKPLPKDLHRLISTRTALRMRAEWWLRISRGHNRMLWTRGKKAPFIMMMRFKSLWIVLALRGLTQWRSLGTWTVGETLRLPWSSKLELVVMDKSMCLPRRVSKIHLWSSTSEQLLQSFSKSTALSLCSRTNLRPLEAPTTTTWTSPRLIQNQGNTQAIPTSNNPSKGSNLS